jgi:quercetin dioxygenase-like cupin family protein
MAAPLGAAMANPYYTVKDIELVAEAKDLRAQIFTLAPGEEIPWHWHSQITDRFFCLAGTLRIETRAPRADERIAVGGIYAVPPKTAHRSSNGDDGEDCRFLLLQGVGDYDFNRI